MLSYYEALNRGLPVYNTGAKCKRNHPRARYVKTNQCVYCSREAKKKSSDKIKMERMKKESKNNPYITFSVTVHVEDQVYLHRFIQQLSIDRQLTEAEL